ncbi:MAG TPA: 16S rRNA (cytidine(1402)-2'-O)-methyltransferase [Vicinamibacterales bacterium]|nr:16S rRNA (cytidine(1402)-2'-O)-methyltransferase [Vicinamibacterales bacterium]
MQDPASGTLFVVATPIGNLEDISLRALRVLREADLVAAEDTRRSGALLQHYAIGCPTTSLHEHNESRKVPALVNRLRNGARIALVTDAGTPSVSDPGFRLVKAAAEAGIRVEAVPGPSAVLAALVASGLPTDAFVFAGFPPSRGAARGAWFDTLKGERRTVVFFEAPHRVRRTLEDLLRLVGNRRVAIGRELTKLHEEVVRGRLSAVLERLSPPRGEYTIVVGGEEEETPDRDEQVSDNQLFEEFSCLTENNRTRREAIRELAEIHGMRARDVFAALDRVRRP